MRGNSLVQFLEGLEAVPPPGYSAGGEKRVREDNALAAYFMSTVPADSEGKQQHVVEVLNFVDAGTAIDICRNTFPHFDHNFSRHFTV